ncbi:MAG: circularly permuted type 2 ATP-grasp protein [Pseudomonadales bacterium]|nr:circularly permuted type 2 ATP-grasp protein [Pseudomonadales bacterium]
MSQIADSVVSPLSSFDYSFQPGQKDEVFSEKGEIKPHWVYLLESLKELGAEAFREREAKALRILRDDGATYNIYNDSLVPNKVWELDLVPSLISSEEWGGIESGLLERAELFNLLLKDIYGPRDLIRLGVIPPEALLCHRGFLRACQGIMLSGNHQLINHAVDLMRGDDGKMWVLTDRTQSPSGAGYALENRTVMSRIFPSLFRDSHVHRLANYFQRLRTKLTTLAPNQDDPRVVVLTPGAHNETYFEHAYLANYLGFHLVQSGDLVVRNGFVWMKSFDGISRVDVILRRVDDSFCDPVELRGDSQLGVPGLLEVARAGRVVIANPLGSGILENPVFLSYLPAIAKALLGRELRLNTVPT